MGNPIKESPQTDQVESLAEKYSHPTGKNFRNFILLLLVPMPSILFLYTLNSIGVDFCKGDFSPEAALDLTFFKTHPLNDIITRLYCSLAVIEPLTQVNILFFINVNILFWTIALLQGSTWLIDPYWTLLPPLIAHFFQFHPALAPQMHGRIWLALCLLYVWAVRLTHSYFRREEWNFGVREDWRFNDLRERFGWNWIWISFFAVYVSQQMMLVGLVLPFFSLFEAPPVPLDLIDLAITFAALAGILIGYFADTQLFYFMQENERRLSLRKPKIKILNSGLWYYARHPNYFGEQLFWWSFACFAVRFGLYWTLFGTIINSLTLASVTRMTEQRMAKDPTRLQEWESYRNTTSVWIPLPKFPSSHSKKD